MRLARMHSSGYVDYLPLSEPDMLLGQTSARQSHLEKRQPTHRRGNYLLFVDQHVGLNLEFLLVQTFPHLLLLRQIRLSLVQQCFLNGIKFLKPQPLVSDLDVLQLELVESLSFLTHLIRVRFPLRQLPLLRLRVLDLASRQQLLLNALQVTYQIRVGVGLRVGKTYLRGLARECILESQLEVMLQGGVVSSLR